MVGRYFLRSSSRSGMEPVCDEVADVGGHALADAGDGEDCLGIGFRGGQGGELGGLLLDGFGGAAVGADAEGVGCIDFEQGGGLVEQACEGDVVHRSG